MTGKKQNREMLKDLLAAVEDNILSTDGEEILEDVAVEGRDPEKAADHIRELISQSIKIHNQKKLKAAKEGYRLATSARAKYVGSVPESPDEKRNLLHNIIASRNNIPAEITMAFREGEHMSDEDVSSVLEDLVELGFLGNGEDA